MFLEFRKLLLFRCLILIRLLSFLIPSTFLVADNIRLYPPGRFEHLIEPAIPTGEFPIRRFLGPPLHFSLTGILRDQCGQYGLILLGLSRQITISTGGEGCELWLARLKILRT